MRGTISSTYSTGFPGCQPVSMDTNNIKLLSEKPYRVSWKADGTRQVNFFCILCKKYMKGTHNEKLMTFCTRILHGSALTVFDIKIKFDILVCTTHNCCYLLEHGREVPVF
jgi:hypothetical protein